MAISAPRDDNRTPAIMGVSSTDGVTPALIYVNPTNHAVKVDDNTTGSGSTSGNAQRDANRVPTMWGVSSADGKTMIPIYVDGSGNLLINSN